jgi:hypothetical protein
MNEMNKIENEIEDMIPIIFENKKDTAINMSLVGIEDIYDLFCFCLDLFIKGLIFLYGTDDNKLNLDSLDQEMLNFTVKQLKKAGIIVTIEEDIDIYNSNTKIIIPEKDIDKYEVGQYKLKIYKKSNVYTIYFSLGRFV